MSTQGNDQHATAMLADETGIAEPARPPPHWRIAACLWSLLALLLGLALSLLVQNQQWQREEAQQWSARTELANKVHDGLRNQLESLETLMRATQSLYLASDTVEPQEFADFYRNMRPHERFPALLALSYAPRTQDASGTHYIIQLVEPRKQNTVLIGLDEATQKNNLAGLLHARDSDEVTMSAPFHLMQPGTGSGSTEDVILRLPIFTPGTIPQNVAERRRRELGTMFASFRLNTFISRIVPKGMTRLLRLRVSDVTGKQPVLLYDSAPGSTVPDAAADRYGRTLEHGGRTWDVAIYPLAAPVNARHWAPLLTGALASVLLAMLVYAIVGTRHRALELGWRMSRRYRESEERFRALNERLPALVLLANSSDGHVIYANQAARARFGACVIGHRLAELFEDAQPTVLAGAGAAIDQLETDLIDESGSRFWANVAISHVTMNGSDKMLMVAGDISEQRRLTERLSYQASHDALTELFNRHEFEQRLRDALATVVPGTQAMLLYVDLDQFKLINDTSGHLAGDQLLVQLSAVMRRQLRDNDVLARLGGDEFGILAFGVADLAAAEQMAERLRRSIDGHVFSWEQRSYLVSASIGGVLLDGPSAQVKDLLAQADAACYIAKEHGRNRVHFHSERDDVAQQRRGEMDWAQRLQWAVDRGLLLLAYQEIRNAAPAADDGVHVELLLRYRDENGALLAPGVFLPAAERYGLMPTIDRWVAQVALSHFNRLHPAGAKLRTASINLSGASIEDAGFADQIVEWLNQYQVEPQRVCFEITETVAVRNLAAVERCMGRLRAAGCRIALDDFGAGMSSFTYLKNLPIDVIKIDGSFVRDMLTDPVSRLMVRAVTDIAHQLGLAVVAEWVTDDATVQALAGLGVNGLQGYAVHQPELTPLHRG